MLEVGPISSDALPRSIDIVAMVTKQGWVFVFDRVTGQPIWPIEQHAVPVSTVPGERALLEYQTIRVGRIIERLSLLSDEDQEDMMRVLHKLHGMLDRGA